MFRFFSVIFLMIFCLTTFMLPISHGQHSLYITDYNHKGIARKPLSFSPNDPLFPFQKNLGIINSIRSWEGVYLQQRQIKVAVIDSGITPHHYDLENKIILGYNVLKDNSDIIDNTGHGTKVAGILAAEHNNGLGISGVTGPFDVKIVPIKVIDTGMTTTSAENITAAINYAISQRVDVINISFGGLEYSAAEHNAIKNAVKSNIVVVAPSGNDSSHNTYYPAAYDEVISVGSHDPDLSISKFTSVNSGLDILAPGSGIYTTMHTGNISTPSLTYGSSFAAPHVAGVCAMIKAISPSHTPAQIKEILLNTANVNEARYLCLNSIGALQTAADLTHSTEIELEYDHMRLAAGYEKFSIKATTLGDPNHMLWHIKDNSAYNVCGEEFFFGGNNMQENGFVQAKLPFSDNFAQCSYTYKKSDLITNLDNGLWDIVITNGFLIEPFDPNVTNYAIISENENVLPTIKPRIGIDITYGEKHPTTIGDTYKITVMDSQGNKRTYSFEIKPPEDSISAYVDINNNTAIFTLTYCFNDNPPSVLYLLCAVYNAGENKLLELRYKPISPTKGVGYHHEELEIPLGAIPKIIVLKDIKNLVPY